jgi:hypothetical protein
MSQAKLIDNPQINELLKEGSVEEALRQPLAKQGGGDDALGRYFTRGLQTDRQQAGAYAGLTLGDFLYDYIRIDPTVVEGIDFARATDLDNMVSFAHFAKQYEELAGEALAGSINQMQGYVAERLVAQHYTAQGHDVSFPEAPNQKGWDILLDGKEAQIKNWTSKEGVLDHLETYPDIPVIANAELADELAGTPNVYIDPELHHDEVVEATKTALDRGAELGDFEIPWISLAVSGAANLQHWARGNTDMQGLLTNTATDTMGRTVCGVAGKYSGAAIGSLLFGPAGFIVVGGVGAILGAAVVGRWAALGSRRLLVAAEEKALRDCAGSLADRVADLIPEKQRVSEEKSERIASSLAGGAVNRDKLHDYVAARMQDTHEYLANKRAELHALAHQADEGGDTSKYVQGVLTHIRRVGVHPHRIQEELQRLGGLSAELTSKMKKYKLA